MRLCVGGRWKKPTLPSLSTYLRCGSTDSGLRGLSSFMAEMVDARSILNTATSSSLVILDELGRGTSSNEGIGISYAVASRLAKNIGCRTLMATHFHELTLLEKESTSTTPIINRHFSAVIEEQSSKVVLSYHLKPGPSSQSFGLQIAGLAGFPQIVIRQAQERLEELQRQQPAEALPSSSRSTPPEATRVSRVTTITPSRRRDRDDDTEGGGGPDTDTFCTCAFG